MESTTKTICVTVSSIVTALVLGEMFGNCISRPIAAWKGAGISKTKVAELFCIMNERICNLEEKKGESTMAIGELEDYRKEAIEIAKNLTYSEDTICDIEHATTVNQIGNIMAKARMDSSDRDIEFQIARRKNKLSNEKN